jgi:hypothetical protein
MELGGLFYLRETTMRFCDLTLEEKLELVAAYYRGATIINAVSGEEVKTPNLRRDSLVSYSIKHSKLVVPWSVIDPRWQFAAADGDGKTYAYIKEPVWKEGRWVGTPCFRLCGFVTYERGSIEAVDSLIERPSCG